MTLAVLAAATFAVADGLFGEGRDRGLRPLAGTEHATIFAAPVDRDRFNNDTVLIGFRGRLHAQWQSSAKDEDTRDTRVLFATSADGLSWTAPRELAPAGTGGAMHSNGGWWTDGRTLVAYINVWPTGFQSGEGGWTEYRTSRDGRSWSPPSRVTGGDGRPVEGIIEQDPHVLPGGRIVTAFHLRPGLMVAPHYTDDPLGVSGWRRAEMPNLPHEGRMSRELEPSLFRAGDCAVMVFRDREPTFRMLATKSCDRGETWSRPAVTAMPDAQAKLSAGNLPGGAAYLVNAPNEARPRIPLAITLSADGRCFGRAHLLRGAAELPPLRHEGRYKRPGFHYPKSVVWAGISMSAIRSIRRVSR